MNDGDGSWVAVPAAHIDTLVNGVRKEAQVVLLGHLQNWFASAEPAQLLGANYTAGEWGIGDVRTGARKHLQSLINNITVNGPL